MRAISSTLLSDEAANVILGNFNREFLNDLAEHFVWEHKVKQLQLAFNVDLSLSHFR